jgi:hypothetical protein
MPAATDTVDIVLATLNAKYIHASLGLRYLQANMDALRERCTIREFTIQQRAHDIVEQLLALNPEWWASVFTYGMCKRRRSACSCSRRLPPM